MVPRDGGVAWEIVDVGAVIAGGKRDGGKIENRGDQDDAVQVNRVVVLQIISQSGGTERAVALANQKLGRIPAVVAAQVGVDELSEGVHVFIDAVEIFFRRFADNVAVPGAHGVDEDEIVLVEKAFGIVHELVGGRRSEGAVDGPSAARAESTHVQPHGGGAGSSVIEEGDGACAEVLDVGARVSDGIHQSRWVALVILEA